MCALGLRAPSFANGTLLFRCSKCEHLVLAKNIAHDMKSGADGAHFFGALLLTFSFDKHIGTKKLVKRKEFEAFISKKLIL